MEKGPQYISLIRSPQYICSIRERVHNTLVNKEKGPQYISAILKRVHNVLVQYGKRFTIH